jgi:N-acetylglutamate synthase-like GNAT family acetyltransferase
MEDMLAKETDPNITRIFVAEAEGKVVCAAWIRFMAESEFGGLYGGSTLAEYRGRGIYKALVAVRAAEAVAHGCKYLTVDCSEDSRPILQRLGFVAVTTTTPYVWRP